MSTFPTIFVLLQVFCSSCIHVHVYVDKEWGIFSFVFMFALNVFIFTAHASSGHSEGHQFIPSVALYALYFFI